MSNESATQQFGSYEIRRRNAMRRKQIGVRNLLEKSYKMDTNDVEKILESYFSEDFLPNWYFHSNSAAEISNHVYIITQLLNARTDYLRQISNDGKAITYFVNVGRNLPGKMLSLVEENLGMGIVSFDTVITRSGIRIVTMERRGREVFTITDDERREIDDVIVQVRDHGEREGYKHTDDFLRSLPPNYMNEEINALTYPRRILRHLDLFEEAAESTRFAVRVQNTEWEVDDENEKLDKREVRLAVAMKNPAESFVPTVMEAIKDAGINMHRSYFDTFENRDVGFSVATLSVYMSTDVDVDPVARRIEKTTPPAGTNRNTAESYRIEEIMRTISDDSISTEEAHTTIEELKELVHQAVQGEAEGEVNEVLINALTDFIQASDMTGIASSEEAMRKLLSFESFDEFWVETRLDMKTRNLPGYRFKHNSYRGPHKGGIRCDPVVDFNEVAALAFMMTLKCARTKLLFSGANGGMRIDPKLYREKDLEFAETLSNFGRSLFLVTGPAHDIAAGDIGVGTREIGLMFEGFKSALRDISLLAYGVKSGVGVIGDSVVSMEQARRMLLDNFGVDFHDRELLRELASSERYLELVAAPQITGKPKLGIDASRDGAGRGLRHSIEVTVANLYAQGKWKISGELSKKALEAIERVTRIDETSLIEGETISEKEWSYLEKSVWPKLFDSKGVVVQGFGKVGMTLLEQLSDYGIRILGVSDRSGAVIGDGLDLKELIRIKQSTGRVIEAKKNVTQVIEGPEGDAAVLETPCDILVPAAMESCVHAENAPRISTVIEACGSNDPNTAVAERILNESGIVVVYDFLANSGGVITGYFEWLRNYSDRLHYESTRIHGVEFDRAQLDRYIMPEFKERIRTILSMRESEETTRMWNSILRDIIIAAVNEDYRFAVENGVRMKQAGMARAQRRVCASMLVQSNDATRTAIWNDLSVDAKKGMIPYLRHPEISQLYEGALDVAESLANDI